MTLAQIQDGKQDNPFMNFEVGSIYNMTYIGDSDLKVAFICVKRTAKTVTFERFKNPEESMTRRIKHSTDGMEYVLDGNYSMAPSIRAKNCIG